MLYGQWSPTYEDIHEMKFVACDVNEFLETQIKMIPIGFRFHCREETVTTCKKTVSREAKQEAASPITYVY